MDPLDQENPVQNEVVQVKSPHITWVIIITAVVVAVLVGGGTYLLLLQRINNLGLSDKTQCITSVVIPTSTKKIQDNTLKSTTTVSTSTIATKTSKLPSFLPSSVSKPDTSSWASYNSKDYGFSIKYPSTLSALKDSSNASAEWLKNLPSKDEGYVYATYVMGKGGYEDAMMVIQVLTNNSKLNVNEWMKNYDKRMGTATKDFISTETKYTVDGKPALRYYFKGSPQSYAFSHIYFVDDKYTYDVQCQHNSRSEDKIAKDEKTCLEWLSTFSLNK